MVSEWKCEHNESDVFSSCLQLLRITTFCFYEEWISAACGDSEWDHVGRAVDESNQMQIADIERELSRAGQCRIQCGQ